MYIFELNSRYSQACIPRFVFRRRAEARGRRHARDLKRDQSPEFIAQGQTTSTSYKYDPDEDAGSGFRIEPPRFAHKNNGLSQPSSMIHPVIRSSVHKNVGSSAHNTDVITQRPCMPQTAAEISNTTLKKDQRIPNKDSVVNFQTTLSLCIFYIFL